MTHLRVFVGHDGREAVGLQVFIDTLLAHASELVSINVITERIGTKSDGSNAFTKSRFLVPWFCDFEGVGVWMDGADMMLRGDVYDLVQELDHRSAVQVVKHDYKPRAERKYLGTDMESDNISYPRKNWSSLMVFRCGHAACRKLTPEYVTKSTGQHLHRFEWLQENLIGELPTKWNWLDEYGPNHRARIIHYTNGIPAFTAYRDAPHADEWWESFRRAQRGLQDAGGKT